MAKNERIFRGTSIPLTCASGTKSGDLVVVGGYIGIAQIDADATTNVATVDIGGGTYNLSVKGVTNGPANSAVAQGDKLYYNAGHTPKVDKDTSGTFIGVAWEPVISGGTATIGVTLTAV